MGGGWVGFGRWVLRSLFMTQSFIKHVCTEVKWHNSGHLNSLSSTHCSATSQCGFCRGYNRSQNKKLYKHQGGGENFFLESLGIFLWKRCLLSRILAGGGSHKLGGKAFQVKVWKSINSSGNEKGIVGDWTAKVNVGGPKYRLYQQLHVKNVL